MRWLMLVLLVGCGEETGPGGGGAGGCEAKRECDDLCYWHDYPSGNRYCQKDCTFTLRDCKTLDQPDTCPKGSCD